MLEGALSAKEADLSYVTDGERGFTRKRKGRGFVFLDIHGKPIRDEKTLNRIRSLVLPPAWSDIWICRHANGHLQATGRDARNRKQYRYHPDWNKARNETKFSKMRLFGELLPDLRAQLEKELSHPGLNREKVLAAVIRMLDETHIRVGNEIYAQENHSYGLTTLHNNHVEVHGQEIKLKFRAKSGVLHESTFKDRRLARIIRACQDLPGEDLFGYETESGEVCSIGSHDVNQFLKEITGQDISAKDFRTWAGTVAAAENLFELGQAARLPQVIKYVASTLGNTPAVCRKYYVHPQLFEFHEAGHLPQFFAKAKRQKTSLSLAEKATLEFLRNLE